MLKASKTFGRLGLGLLVLGLTWETIVGVSKLSIAVNLTGAVCLLVGWGWIGFRVFNSWVRRSGSK